MIIKFLSRKSNSGQLLQYICRYIFHDEKLTTSDLLLNGANQQDKFLIKHHVRARTIKGFVREFNENESYRLVQRKDSVRIFHTIISFGSEDRKHITDHILKDIAHKFIEERGSNCLYVGSKHEDKAHIHLHICSSGTQLNGRSARMSNQKFRSIKLSLERYQRMNYPFLSHSLVEHGQKKQQTKETFISALKANRQSNKVRLIESLERVYSQSKSKEEFLVNIKTLGHEPYLRNGELQGILSEGKVKYRFSRLGFDKGRFDKLNLLQENTSTLLKLNNLRKGIYKETKNEIQKNPEPVLESNTAEMSKIQELETIRGKAKENEKERDDGYERIRDFDERPMLPTLTDDTQQPFLPVPISKLLPVPMKTNDAC